MRRTVVVCLAVLLLLGSFTTFALADDRVLPPWQRGGDRTTFERWEFDDANPMPEPDDVINTYGFPQMTIVPGPEPLGGWWQYYDNRVGVWGLSGTIDVTIPNAPGGFQKDLWIQLTWEQIEGPTQQPPIVEVDGTLGRIIQQTPVTPGNWIHTTWLVTLPYNPPIEWLHIGGDIMVDELVVDTKCTVPEPSTLVLLGLGGVSLLAVAARRRFAKKA